MKSKTIKKPFKNGFLSQFVIIPELLPFSDEDIKKIDKELAEFELLFLSPDIEKNILTKNELLASFAISKAENSALTLEEAKEVYALVCENHEFKFISDKLKNGKKLTAKDYEKLEFFNIAKTFKKLNQNPLPIKDLTPQAIKDIHFQLTQGLDIFEKYLSDFTAYKSGKWRDNNKIRVDEYIPAPFKEIEIGIKELLSQLKKNPNVSALAAFHTALYALHPFNNGNKRVCRILEHILLRQIGLNSKNLYSTSYYYHKQKPRYYKYLLYSLERKNLNHFSSFVLEAIVLSIISVVKTSLETKRGDFLSNFETDEKIKTILKPLIKRKKIQFKNLFKTAKKKVSRQTFVTYLQKAEKEKLILKQEQGKAVFYSLKISLPEEAIIKNWVEFASSRIAHIPDEIKLI